MKKNTMKAIICPTYGPPEVLQVQEVPKPSPKENQLLVKIMATAVNSGDVRVRSLDVSGILRLVMRLVLGINKPRKPILGTVYAGVVESVGSKVTSFKTGDKVFGMTGFGFGTYAEYRAVNEKSHVLPMPLNASFEEAAAIVFGGQTAIRYLEKAQLKGRRNPTVLIIGATGSVGSAAVQIAKHFGAAVTAVCSSKGRYLVEQLGVQQIIEYDKENAFDQLQQYDIIFDAVGKAQKRDYKNYLSSGGAYVSVAKGYAAEDISQLELLKELVEKGNYHAAIDKVYAMHEVVEAHRYVATGRKKGNVVLRLG